MLQVYTKLRAEDLAAKLAHKKARQANPAGLKATPTIAARP